MIGYKFRLKSGGLVDTGVNGFWSPTLTAKDPEIPYLPLEDAAGGGYTLNGDAGAYTIAGTAATLIHNRVLNGDAGAYVLTGTPATLLHNRVLNADPGAYALAGTDATFVYTPSGTVYTLNAEPGAYSISGAGASFVYSGAQQSYSGEVKVYVKRGKKYYFFDTQAEADEWVEAETEANEAIEQAQKTSRRARKRLREKVYKALPEADVVDTTNLLQLAQSFNVTFDMQSLIMSHNISQLIEIRDRLIQLQDEDDIEMLVLSLP